MPAPESVPGYDEAVAAVQSALMTTPCVVYREEGMSDADIDTMTPREALLAAEVAVTAAAPVLLTAHEAALAERDATIAAVRELCARKNHVKGPGGYPVLTVNELLRVLDAHNPKEET